MHDSSQESPPCPTDWKKKCVTRQKDNPSDRLQCPAEKNDGAENLTAFSHLGCLPFSMAKLDERHSVEETFRQMKANVHNLCKLSYIKSQPQRANKRKFIEEEDCRTE